MSISPGVRLGPYEVQTALGAGGMGEVYRARDTRLDRTVALKVVSAPLAGLAEFRERIEREARVVSALEHPHICALYDVGEHEGTPYLVMQYLEGETLADRLKAGPLPVAQAVDVAAQIAGALDAAHRAGVVHRDLKPGNVMLTKSGAKLLDFGLAKIGQATAAVGAASMMATEQTPMTAQGTILGTWQYMAPEQIEGQEADARTDIFAFGVLLFEMLTGRKAFEGKTQASLFGAILHKAPPQIATGDGVPPALARLVGRCLAKDPDQRWQSARDLEWELRTLQAEPESAPAAAVAAARPSSRRSWTLMVVTVAALAGAGTSGYLLWRLLAAPAPPVARLAVSVEPATSLRNSTLTGSIVAISNDGRQVAFVGAGAGTRQQLFVRAIDQESASPLAGTTDGFAPAFSPDGRWIAYGVAGAIMKVEVAGGAPQVVAKIGGGARGIVWLDNEWIAYGAQGPGGLMRVRAAGAEPEQLTTVDSKAGEVLHAYPSVHPARPVVFFTVLGSGTTPEGDTVAVDLQTGARRTIVRNAAGATLTRTGHLLFLRGGNVMAVAIDPDTLDVAGAPVTAQPGIDIVGNTGNWSLAGDGTLAYVRGGAGGSDRRSLMWLDGGRTQAAADLQRTYDDPRVSPNGRYLAVEITSEGNDIWVLDLMRGTTTRLTFDPGEDETPAWSPDGVWVAYASDRAGQQRTVFRKRADGSGPEEKLWTTPEHTHVEAWTPDGRSLLVMRQTGGQADLWLVPVGGGGEPRVVLQEKFREYGGRVSPDGRWLAYTSNESGEDQVYVQPFPELGAKWQISAGGGAQPVWSADGRRLLYRGETSVMAVDVEANGRAFAAGVPRRLFEDTFQRKGDTHTGWDVARDGRMLFVRTAGETGRPTMINVTLHWLADVARRVQADR